MHTIQELCRVDTAKHIAVQRNNRIASRDMVHRVSEKKFVVETKPIIIASVIWVPNKLFDCKTLSITGHFVQGYQHTFLHYRP